MAAETDVATLSLYSCKRCRTLLNNTWLALAVSSWKKSVVELPDRCPKYEKMWRQELPRSFVLGMPLDFHHFYHRNQTLASLIRCCSHFQIHLCSYWAWLQEQTGERGWGAKRERTRAAQAEQLRQQQGSCFTGVGSLLQLMLHTRDARDALLQLPLRAVLHHLKVLLHHIPPAGEPVLRLCRLPRTSNVARGDAPLRLCRAPATDRWSWCRAILPRPIASLSTVRYVHRYASLPLWSFFYFFNCKLEATNQLNYPRWVTLHSNNGCET
jgi:hypothetical protein